MLENGDNVFPTPKASFKQTFTGSSHVLKVTRLLVENSSALCYKVFGFKIDGDAAHATRNGFQTLDIQKSILVACKLFPHLSVSIAFQVCGRKLLQLLYLLLCWLF